jgi:hypothetical protein
MGHSSEHVIIIAGALSTLSLLSPTTLPYHRIGGTPSTSICDAAAPRLPASVTIQPGLEAVVQWTLENSPTFRQQCRTLEAAPHVTASVQITTRSPGSTERALTTMRRDRSGAIDARIEIRSGGDLTELLGHELEHVIEQVDGVNLERLESAGQAHRLGNGSFETRRAIVAGQRVSGEVLDGSPDRVRGAMNGLWRLLAWRR